MSQVPPLVRKLEELSQRFETLQASLNDPAVLTNPQRIIAASKEAGQLEPVVQRYRDYQKAQQAVEELRSLAANKSDAEMSALAAAELPDAESKATAMMELIRITRGLCIRNQQLTRNQQRLSHNRNGSRSTT